jgi:hypothetical protein
MPSKSLVCLLVSLLAAGGALILAASPAAASCAAGPSAPSTYAFAGVVVSTSLGGRVAVVRTETGARVIVRGTTATAANQATSVDRTYQVGARYGFEPTNASSPYLDNICTGTRLLGPAAAVTTAAPSRNAPGGTVAPPAARPGEQPPGQPAAVSVGALLAVTVAGLITAAAVGALILRRSARSPGGLA